ncbi:MAG: hypothetical protein R3315_00430 [Woeseiaceae bacterium]|nr:hypothetical protein [Woeseiaceae bacterium]
MKATRGAQRPGRRIGYIAAAAILLASIPAGAASNFDPDCPSLEPDADAAATLPAPVLRIEMTELMTPPTPLTRHALATRETPAMNAGQAVDELLDTAELAADDVEAADREVQSLPPTATRLPGVDAEELPRFRRQMFRTDI